MFCSGVLFLQYAIVNWPVAFDISAPFVPLSAASGGSDQAAASALGTSGNAKFAWAVAKMAATGSTEFQMPDDYFVNTQDSQDRRKRKEEVFRAQWAQALQLSLRWSWLCSVCVTELGTALIGAEVNVWWHDDEEGYRGTINAFDQVSGCHRVLYADGEWEFVNLAIEPTAFAREEGFSLLAPAGKKKK
jgi:hypothetical protein